MCRKNAEILPSLAEFDSVMKITGPLPLFDPKYGPRPALHHYLGAYLKWGISDPTPCLLNQNLHFNEAPRICAYPLRNAAVEAAPENPEWVVIEAMKKIWVWEIPFAEPSLSLASSIYFKLCLLERGLESSFVCPFISRRLLTSNLKSLLFLILRFLLFENDNYIPNWRVCLWSSVSGV